MSVGHAEASILVCVFSCSMTALWTLDASKFLSCKYYGNTESWVPEVKNFNSFKSDVYAVGYILAVFLIRLFPTEFINS